MTNTGQDDPLWFKPGDHLGDYGIVRVMDRGTFSYNLEVQDLAGRRFHAVVHHRDDLRPDVTLAGIRFEAGLSHPGLPRIEHVGVPCQQSRGHVWFVREFLDSPWAYRVWTSGQPLSAEDVLQIGCGVCKLLEYLHDPAQHSGRKVVHGFLVPGYIHRAGDGPVKVAGLDVQSLVRSGIPVPMRHRAYRCPECLDAAPDELTPANDLWALAGCLLFLATAQAPMETDVAGIEDLKRAHEKRIPQQLAANVPDPQLREILLRAFAFDPRERFQTAHEFRRAIEMRPRERPAADIGSARGSPDVFISYGGKTATAAEAVCSAVEAFGYKCWLRSRDIAPNRVWDEQITDAIEQSTVFVQLLSAAAKHSASAFHFLTQACNHNIRILVVRVEDVVPSGPMKDLTAKALWFDAFPLMIDHYLPRLTETIDALLAGRTPRHALLYGPSTAGPCQESAASIEDQAFSSQTVITHYPAPIATAYGRFFRHEDPATRLRMLFAALEATLRYLVTLGVSDLFRSLAASSDNDPQLPAHDAFAFLRRRTPMTLGMWQDALRETARHLLARGDGLISELPVTCAPNGPLLALVQRLIGIRNKCIHEDGSIAMTPEECREIIRDARPLLEELLQRIHFVRNYPLGFVRRSTGSGAKPDRCRYSAYSCMGARVANTAEAFVVEVPIQLQEHVPFVVTPDGARLLYLWPLLRQRFCSTSQRHSLYVFEEVRGKRQYLTGIRSAAIDIRDSWEEDLDATSSGSFQWLTQRLRALPAAVDLPSDSRLATKLLPSRGGKLVGGHLGSNRLLAAVASGGFGTVYAAQSASGERVAVKVIESPEAMRHYHRFRREFQKLKEAAGHAGIVRCYELDVEVIQDREYPWYSMEFALGGDLSSRILERRAERPDLVPWQDVTLYETIVGEFIAVVDAVAHLHQLGIVHRDIKPSNVLIMEDGTLRLSDFGLAKKLEPSDQSLMESPQTSTGAVLGTRQYMSPEQERGQKVDQRTDVYSLGILLAELATGQRPEPDTHVSQGTTLHRWQPLKELPKPLARIIRRCTDVEREPRFQDAERLADAFARLVVTVAESEAIPSTARPAPEQDAVLQAPATPAARPKVVVPTSESVSVSGGDVPTRVYQTSPSPTPPTRSDQPLPVITNSIGMKRALIPAGEFLMGSPDSEEQRSSNEGPQHRVRITRPFYLGVYPVTQAEYERVMGVNPSRFKSTGPTAPVERVCWQDAQEFCRRLSECPAEQEAGHVYRLPTEAEWEYACRAGSTSMYCFGDALSQLGQYAWYGENSERETHPVGQKKPNGWGLYDMHGNVWEWCADWYGGDYYAASPEVDPPGSERGSLRVYRGGCWGSVASRCRSAFRGWDVPGRRHDACLGFRLARTVS